MADPTYQNDLVLLSTYLTHDGLARPAVVTLAMDDAGVNASAQAWADLIQALFVSMWAPAIDNQVAISRTVALKGDGTSVFTTGESTAAGDRGSEAASTLPSNCALLVKKLTGVGGRRNRGRMYLPWAVPENLCDEMGNIDVGLLADFQTAADNYMAALVATTGHPVIANRIYDRAWDVPGRRLVSTNIGETITSLNVEPIIATQRRRMPRS